MRLGSWLGKALNPSLIPLKKLLFARNFQEDERLAMVAAVASLPAQPRVADPNGLTVAIFGCGRMGCDIAVELMRRGTRTILYEAAAFKRDALQLTISAMLEDMAEREFLLPSDVDVLLSRVTVATEMVTAVTQAQVYLDAILESVEAKQELFAEIAACCWSAGIEPTSILFWTTSLLIPLSVMVAAMEPAAYRSRVVSTRFFAPAAFIDLVEVTPQPEPSAHYDPQNMSSAMQGQWEAWAAGQASRVGFVAAAEVAIATSVHVLGQLRYRPVAFEGGTRRRLTEEEAALYAIRQRTQCRADKARMAQMQALTLANAPPVGGYAGGNAAPTGGMPIPPMWGGAVPLTAYDGSGASFTGSSASVPTDKVSVTDAASTDSRSSPTSQAGEESCSHDLDMENDYLSHNCAVCMAAPVATLLRPCGHMAMCTDCAERVFVSCQPYCCICRTVIEATLQVPPHAAAAILNQR